MASSFNTGDKIYIGEAGLLSEQQLFSIINPEAAKAANTASKMGTLGRGRGARLWIAWMALQPFFLCVCVHVLHFCSVGCKLAIASS